MRYQTQSVYDSVTIMQVYDTAKVNVVSLTIFFSRERLTSCISIHVAIKLIQAFSCASLSYDVFGTWRALKKQELVQATLNSNVSCTCSPKFSYCVHHNPSYKTFSLRLIFRWGPDRDNLLNSFNLLQLGKGKKPHSYTIFIHTHTHISI